MNFSLFNSSTLFFSVPILYIHLYYRSHSSCLVTLITTYLSLLSIGNSLLSIALPKAQPLSTISRNYYFVWFLFFTFSSSDILRIILRRTRGCMTSTTNVGTSSTSVGSLVKWTLVVFIVCLILTGNYQQKN